MGNSMKRKYRKKKKQRISINKTIIIAIIASVILFLLLLSGRSIENRNIVRVDKLNFEHIGDKEYLVFDIKNPTDEEKTCSFRVITVINEYQSINKTTIKPKSEKNIKIAIYVPNGESDVDLIYTCR